MRERGTTIVGVPLDSHSKFWQKRWKLEIFDNKVSMARDPFHADGVFLRVFLIH